MWVIARRCWPMLRLPVNPGDRNATLLRAGPTGRYISGVTAIPTSFRAYVAEKVDGPDGTPAVERGLRDFAAADLPPGEVEIRVEWSSRQLQGRPRDEGRRQGRPDQPADPGDRPGRDGRRVIGDPTSRSARRSSPTATTSASPGTAATRSTSACRPVGSCRWPADRAPHDARRDGDRDGRVHRRDVRRGARGARPAPWRRPGPRHGGERRRRLDGRRDPGRARPRGLGGHRQGRRGGATARAGRRRHPDPRRGHRAGQAARVGALGGRGRRGRRGHAALRPADPPDRGRGRVERQCRAGRSSTRRCSRSSCAASPCSGWTRRRWRSRSAGRSGPGSPTTSGRAASARA